MRKKDLEAELRMKEMEIAYLRDMVNSLREQRDNLTDVLVNVFGSRKSE